MSFRGGPAAAVLVSLLALGAHATAVRAADLAFSDPRLQSETPLEVSLPGVTPGGGLPVNYSADGRNISPPIGWSAGPAATRSYALVMQDGDAPTPATGVHWIVYDIPAGVVVLPRGMKNVAAPSKPLGTAQGANDHGSFGYSGPRVAAGQPAHHYHFEVFALDRPMRVHPGASLATVIQAMSGHVVARGELVATYSPPAPKTRPQPDGASASSAPVAPG